MNDYTKVFRELQTISANLVDLNKKFTCLEKAVQKKAPVKEDRMAAYGAVFRLRAEGLRYSEIRKVIIKDFGIKLSDSTLFDWLIAGKKPHSDRSKAFL